jgi:hypothetical protein
MSGIADQNARNHRNIGNGIGVEAQHERKLNAEPLPRTEREPNLRVGAFDTVGVWGVHWALLQNDSVQQDWSATSK